MTKNTSTEIARPRRLNIRLSQQEWDNIHQLAAGTTCRSISEYARKVLSRKPVRVFYRNKSFDAFEEQMTRLIPLLENFAENNDQPGFITTVLEIKAHIEKLSDQTSDRSNHPPDPSNHPPDPSNQTKNLSNHATQNNDLPQHHPLPDL